MKSYIHKINNKRVVLAYNDEKKWFFLQFKRLKLENETIEITPKDATCTTELLRNKLVITTIVLSQEAGYMIVLNFKKFFEDLENGMYPNFNITL